jgi:hypothetical protein
MMNRAGLPHEHLDCSDNCPALQHAIWLLAGRCQKVLNAMDPGDSLSSSIHHRASAPLRAWLATHDFSSADWGILCRSIFGRKDPRVAKQSVERGARTRLSGAEEHRATRPVSLAMKVIGSFVCKLRDALSPSARTRVVPEVEGCDNVVGLL